jgi:hypothetical protein
VRVLQLVMIRQIYGAKNMPENAIHRKTVDSFLILLEEKNAFRFFTNSKYFTV